MFSQSPNNTSPSSGTGGAGQQQQPPANSAPTNHTGQNLPNFAAVAAQQNGESNFLCVFFWIVLSYLVGFTVIKILSLFVNIHRYYLFFVESFLIDQQSLLCFLIGPIVAKKMIIIRKAPPKYLLTLNL